MPRTLWLIASGGINYGGHSKRLHTFASADLWQRLAAAAAGKQTGAELSDDHWLDRPAAAGNDY